MDNEWLKILGTAVITAIVAEPLKTWAHNRSRQWQMRKLIIAEFCSNLRHISRGVKAAKLWMKTAGDWSEARESFHKVVNGTISFSRLEQSQLDYTLFFRIPENEWIVLASHRLQQLVQATNTSEEFGDLIQELELEFRFGINKLNSRFLSRHIAYLNAPASVRCQIKPTPTAMMLMDWRKAVKGMGTLYEADQGLRSRRQEPHLDSNHDCENRPSIK